MPDEKIECYGCGEKFNRYDLIQSEEDDNYYCDIRSEIDGGPSCVEFYDVEDGV